MPDRPKAWLAWSSGKDSAWSLHAVRQAGDFEIVALLRLRSTDAHSRVAMHAVRESLLEMQAARGGPAARESADSVACRNETTSGP